MTGHDRTRELLCCNRPKCTQAGIEDEQGNHSIKVCRFADNGGLHGAIQGVAFYPV